MYYISSVCFLCLGNKKLKKVSRNYKEYNVVKQIKFVLPELVTLKLNNLHICLTCCEAFSSVYKFKKMCLKKYYRFYNYINKLQGTGQEQHFGELQVNVQEDNINLHIDKETQGTNLAENDMDINDELFLCEDIDPNLVKRESVSSTIDNVNNTNHTSHERFNYTTVKEVETGDSFLEECDAEDHLPENEENTTANDVIDSSVKDVLLEKHDTDELVEHDIDIKNEILLCEDKIYEQLMNNESVLSSEDNFNNVSEDMNETTDVNTSVKTNTGRKRHICTYCNKEFLYNYSLLEHVVIHTGVKNYCCTICKKLFAHRGSLRIHMMRHKGIKFKCEICGKQFGLKRSLKLHLEIHMDNKQFQCSYCSKEYSSQYALKKHIELHLRSKQFQCTVCDKQFNKKIELNIHLLIHDGVEAFDCIICDKQFIRKRYLDCHMNTHNVVKEYHCTICKKQFTCRRGLKLHMITHTGVKEFTCHICSKQYFRKNTLQEHMKTHNKQKI